MHTKLSGSTDPPLNVTQFHFTAWPDHGVPDYATTILAFHRRVKSQHDSAKGPLLVHCRYKVTGKAILINTHVHNIATHTHTYTHIYSAGVGRTGTLITIDSVLEKVEEEGVVDIAGTVSKIRQQRMNMVQSVVSMHMYVFGVRGEGALCGCTFVHIVQMARFSKAVSSTTNSITTGAVYLHP